MVFCSSKKAINSLLPFLALYFYHKFLWYFSQNYVVLIQYYVSAIQSLKKFFHSSILLSYYVTYNYKLACNCMTAHLHTEKHYSYNSRIIDRFMLLASTSLFTTASTSTFVTDSPKRGIIADPNSTYLECHNLTCEFATTLKLGPNIPLASHYCVV